MCDQWDQFYIPLKVLVFCDLQVVYHCTHQNNGISGRIVIFYFMVFQNFVLHLQSFFSFHPAFLIWRKKKNTKKDFLTASSWRQFEMSDFTQTPPCFFPMDWEILECRQTLSSDGCSVSLTISNRLWKWNGMEEGWNTDQRSYEILIRCTLFLWSTS